MSAAAPGEAGTLLAGLLLLGGYCTSAMPISEGCVNAKDTATKAQQDAIECLQDHAIAQVVGDVCGSLVTAQQWAKDQADFTCKQEADNPPQFAPPAGGGAPASIAPSSGATDRAHRGLIRLELRSQTVDRVSLLVVVLGAN